MMKKFNRIRIAPEFKLFLALGAVLGVFLVISLAHESAARENVDPNKTAPHNYFAGISITAKSAYVYDVRTKAVLYQKNAAARLPLASLTKVMSALVAEDTSGDSAEVTITPQAVGQDGDSGLLVGERWKMKNLLDFSLIMSSNDGIYAAGEAAGQALSGSRDPAADMTAFVRAMNQKADELSMKNTYYLNDTGLDENTEQGGAYGSAEDMAKLFEYVISTHPDLLEATQNSSISVSSLDKTHTAENTDVLADLIPGLIASKTGYTDLAGGNLVIAFDPELDHPVIVSVLGSTESGRFEDMTALIDAALKQLSTGDQAALK